MPDSVKEAVEAARSAGQGMDSLFREYQKAQGDWAKTSIVQQKVRASESSAKRRYGRLGYAR